MTASALLSSVVVAPVPAAVAAPFQATLATGRSVFTAAAAETPVSLRCAQQADGTVLVTWSSQTDPALGFDILGGDQLLAAVPASARSVRISPSLVTSIATTVIAVRIRANAAPVSTGWIATSGSTTIRLRSDLGAPALSCGA